MLGTFNPPHSICGIEMLCPGHPDYDRRFPWIIREPITYSSEVVSVSIPANFRLDWASVPRFLWFAIPPIGPWARAAAIHDELYRSGKTTKRIADAIFLSVMRQDGVDIVRRHLIYYAVYYFGWPAWNRLRAEGEQTEPDT